MKEVKVTSWEEFEKEVGELNAYWSGIRKNRAPLRVSELLYRGHSDASWELKTTLDRYKECRKAPSCMSDYYRAVHATKHRIETLTEKDWPIPTVSDYQNWLTKYDPFETGEFLAYEYMAYLRHHGFPSPLLDWTTSPFVAAFFAFRDVLSSAENVAVFAYVENTGQGRSSEYTNPYIRALGPYIRSHKRHFLQQSQYTVCITFNAKRPYYVAHQEAFDRNREDQDLLRKFIIPATERDKALKKLESYNINAYSLFGSEESLMETVAIREFILRKKDL